ncbi:ribosome biogenesis GTPase Der [Rhodocaloribacter litoris]|uniref:ribosome biogenesis GTPase Der n=1 Tax=Rhodocaloribacter litoris TaxID=2558931 RepID=UPI00141F1C3F|nr:ribosome biogenesis GTPase Der [Rhodocaloribacter litoris]QXD17013.1 ribosome biogenesis GTPase Der [Rhodocaloribacter litoris]GIV60024.1 MAG: GTPase Der [Rhodothermaceae bacterium]
MSLVAIVGRPNVGKSTFFNRLTESRQAIVHDEPGVTRDRIYGQAFWNGRTFDVVDTGGFVPRSPDRFAAAIREQVHIALDEADLLLFLVDVTTGITDLDEELAALLRRTDKPVLIVANKADNEQRRWEAGVFYQLGLGEVYPVSSLSGSGTGDLLDAVVAALPPEPSRPEDDARVRIAVIGRPNVGKSSLTNALLGQERSIVTEVSGTTRDAVDAAFRYHGQEIVLVDTAGLRKRARLRENVEFYAQLRTERAIQGCDVAVLLLDATQGLEAQDIRVLKEAEQMKKGLVIAVNKWDLIEKDTHTARRYEQAVRERLKTLDYVPVITVSAATGQRIHRLLDLALTVARERQRRIPTSTLNEVVQAAVARTHPPTYRNQHVKIKYAAQVRVAPPVFSFFCNHPRGIREPYRRYLENQLREAFGFQGVPLTLVFKRK